MDNGEYNNGNNDYNFGFDDEEDDNNQINNNFYQNNDIISQGNHNFNMNNLNNNYNQNNNINNQNNSPYEDYNNEYNNINYHNNEIIKKNQSMEHNNQFNQNDNNQFNQNDNNQFNQMNDNNQFNQMNNNNQFNQMNDNNQFNQMNDNNQFNQINNNNQFNQMNNNQNNQRSNNNQFNQSKNNQYNQYNFNQRNNFKEQNFNTQIINQNNNQIKNNNYNQNNNNFNSINSNYNPNNNNFNSLNNNNFNNQNNNNNFNNQHNNSNNRNNNNNYNNRNNNNNFNNQNNKGSNNNIDNNFNSNNNDNNVNNNSYNQFNNNQNLNNQNIKNQNINSQNSNKMINKNNEIKNENPEKERLRNAYNLFMQGVRYYKGLSLEIALDSFEKVKVIIDEVYPKIEKDKDLKETTDKFLTQVKQYINTTEKRIKNKYNYTPTYNYGGKITDPKKEVAKFLKETERASQQRKKINYFVSDTKPKYKDSPSMYTNELKNNVNNATNKNNNVNKKDDKSIITNDLRDKVLSEIVENKPDVKFSDVVGLKEAKQILREIIIVPNLRPDLFKGLRAPPRGLLLFGPPGTGKTMIAKAVATECKCTFFNISASSLTSKYLGESEKLVRTLFELAHEMQPSVVFIDEIESILSKRKEDENDAMKRLKTEFLIQFDGVGSGEDLRVLIIGATNRPFDLDPAIIRRLPKRVYVGPFNVEERKGFIKTIITQNKCNISDEEFLKIAEMCKNYSNSDLKELCREAAYEPLRELNVKSLAKVEELRPIVYEDFNKAVRKVRGTLTRKILQELEAWNKEFGALSNKIKIN